MRILFTIPHFYHAHGSGRHASLRPDPRPRIVALRRCVAALNTLFRPAQFLMDIAQRSVHLANVRQAYECDICIVTTGPYHIVEQLQLPEASYEHVSTSADAPLLGYECQALLRDRLGRYDYYCYLEDDLVLHDPWFFLKLNRFTAEVGDDCLLQPHRYEIAVQGPVQKAYIDGNLAPRVTTPFQDVADRPSITGNVFGYAVRFLRARNPHAGCYFLNQRQMSHWTQQTYFCDRATSFIGPLESAATLGIMRTFRVYKTEPDYANLLEIEHAGQEFLRLIHLDPHPRSTPPSQGQIR